MSKVWLTGDAVVDLIPDGDQHYLKCPGGAPANGYMSVRSRWPINPVAAAP